MSYSGLSASLRILMQGWCERQVHLNWFVLTKEECNQKVGVNLDKSN